ncbi:LlaJI family restriction endonuclease [Avibacterium avium]
MNNKFNNIESKRPLFEYCKNSTNEYGDTFVGIKSSIINGKHSIDIYFPIGYRISKNETDVRNEILQLFSVLKSYGDKQSIVSSFNQDNSMKNSGFPIESYFKILSYYINNGPYKVKESICKKGKSGKIFWNKTINKKSPITTPNGLIYTEFEVLKYNKTDKNLITEISNFCTYDSYLKLGWMYNLPLIQKPIRTRNISEYISYIYHLLFYTNNEQEKSLFIAMKNILEFIGDQNEPEEFHFGTYRFEYIWEKLIEHTYGNENKENYFPKTRWKLRYGEEKENKAIEPDTIMRYKKDIYVLDAKYYKYGISKNLQHLPKSTSINKQISYGEYIKTHDKFENERAQGMDVYNAFLMPFDSKAEPNNLKNLKYYSIGEGLADWKNNYENYHRVQGILIDIKYLMSNSIRPNYKEIEILSRIIIESIGNK